MSKILIVLPTYNEENVLEKNALKLLDFCHKNLIDYDWQILIADNGSTDNSVKIAKNLSQKYPEINYFHTDQKGRGAALKIAWQKYDADTYCYMDIDLATDLQHLLELINYISKEDYDLATGSRLKKESQTERSFIRELTSRAYNFILKLFFPGFPVKDCQCGFKAISKKISKEIIPQIKNNNWFFDTELLILSHKNKFKIKEFPVKWVETRDKTRKSKTKILKTALEDLRGIIRLKFKKINKHNI